MKTNMAFKEQWKRLISWFIFLSLIFIVSMTNTNAQTKYRCGTSFQDKPCADGQGSVVGKTKVPQQNSEKNELLPLDSECAKKGNAALKIIWKRDGGALQEDLLNNEQNEAQRRLIADVYANRGNAVLVRQKIEKECMAEKVSPIRRILSDKQWQEKLDALELKEKSQSASSSSSSDPVSEEKIKQSQCARFQTQLKMVKSELKARGRGDEVATLNTQLRVLEKEARMQQCD